ncbi:ribonuclease H [Senna tora]|uniref:Ribonuclease H n=1 Tax=Senna tora TaxID=362788 RepID=A0A834W8P1_9FABA|nr:ribonuclease H [Senna tora]
MGRCPLSISRISNFKNFIDACGLLDLGFVDQKFMWCNKRGNGRLVFERLDRFLANAAWLNLFPEAQNTHLPRIKSDHIPLILNTYPILNHHYNRPFRCERVWLSQLEFINLAENSWKNTNSIANGLNQIREQAVIWNKTTFGNIFKRKNRVLRRLEGVGRALALGPNSCLVDLEHELSCEYQLILSQEEELWASKSRMDWLHLGDSNTTFFHASVIGRRRPNQIFGLMDQVGNWILDPEQIKLLIINYFSQCFNSSPVQDFPLDINLPQISTTQANTLAAIPSNEEILSALKSLKPFKAPGKDGFQPAFFQKCWHFLGNEISSASKDIFQTQSVDEKKWLPFKLNNINFSHLLFANDVLLFARNDKKSLKAISDTLGNFMNILGLTINESKSSIWFSPTNSPEDKQRASTYLKFRTIQKPANYLGFPLGISNRVSDFNPILDKVKARIESWKSRLLSKAGKVTLLSSVVSSTVAYYMQCLPFPKQICDQLDKAQRDFFWNSTSSERRMHLINWDHICQPKREGGLGLFKSRNRNISLLAKLNWRIMDDHNKVWAKCIQHYQEGIIKGYSTIGRGIRWGKELLDRGTISLVMNGNNTSFWKDNWTGLGPLSSLVQGPLNREDHLLRDKIKKYGALIVKGINLNRRGLAIPIICPLCNRDVETLNHLFRDCLLVREVWDAVRSKADLDTEHDFQLWLKKTVTNQSQSFLGIPSGTLAIFTLTYIWRYRNNLIFKQQRFNPTQLAKRAVANAAELHFLTNNGKDIRPHTIRHISWEAPLEGWFKLNTDGSSSFGLFSVAGVIRDHLGNWVYGFSEFVGQGNSLKAEVWAIYLGLKAACSLNCSHLFVETDSQVAISLILTLDTPTTHHLFPIIAACRESIQGLTRMELQHIFREGNSCADFLAKQAFLDRTSYTAFDTIPPGASINFLADKMGTSFPRRSDN